MHERAAARSRQPRSTALADGAGLLLEHLRHVRSGTISELVAYMGLSRSTVLQRLDLLHDHRLITHRQGTHGARGRPASVSAFNPQAGVVLSAQIGMTGCRTAVTDLDGTVLAERLITMDVPAGPTKMLKDLVRAFDALVRKAGHASKDVVGIGVGIPSSVELLTYTRSLGLEGTHWKRDYVRHTLWQHYQAPVYLDLDVNLLALAERRQGWPDAEVFVCIKLGTLIDSAIVINGVPVRGVNNLAGELGHMKVGGSTIPCSCGSIGCLDAVASGHALVNQMVAAGFEVAHVSDVVTLALHGHPEAVLAIRQAGRQIGEALADVVNLLNPGVIAAWGYLTGAETILLSGIREGLFPNALPGSSQRLQLVSTTLGDLAGVKGAAMMVLDEILSPAAIDRVIMKGSWADAWPEPEKPTPAGAAKH